MLGEETETQIGRGVGVGHGTVEGVACSHEQHMATFAPICPRLCQHRRSGGGPLYPGLDLLLVTEGSQLSCLLGGVRAKMFLSSLEGQKGFSMWRSWGKGRLL